MGAFITIYVYACEVYPTRVRGTVFGLFGVCRSIGQLSSPFAALVCLIIEEKNRKYSNNITTK